MAYVCIRKGLGARAMVYVVLKSNFYANAVQHCLVQIQMQQSKGQESKAQYERLVLWALAGSKS